MTCHICTKIFTDEIKLKAHYRNKHAERKHECESCERKFACHSQLMYHQPYCSFSFDKKKCDKCNYEFISYSDEVHHRKIIHKQTVATRISKKTKEKVFHCKFCKEEFPYEYSRAKHERKCKEKSKSDELFKELDQFYEKSQKEEKHLRNPQ